jgi:hypothetical protein
MRSLPTVKVPPAIPCNPSKGPSGGGCIIPDDNDDTSITSVKAVRYILDHALPIWKFASPCRPSFASKWNPHDAPEQNPASPIRQEPSGSAIGRSVPIVISSLFLQHD